MPAGPWPQAQLSHSSERSLYVARGQHTRAEIKLFFHYLVLDHCFCNMGTGCKEFYDYWILDVNKTDEWVV